MDLGRGVGVALVFGLRYRRAARRQWLVATWASTGTGMASALRSPCIDLSTVVTVRWPVAVLPPVVVFSSVISGSPVIVLSTVTVFLPVAVVSRKRSVPCHGVNSDGVVEQEDWRDGICAVVSRRLARSEAQALPAKCHS